MSASRQVASHRRAVERVAGRVGLDAREQLDERLERVDADGRLLGDGVALHPGCSSATRRAGAPTPGELEHAARPRATGGGRRTPSRCCSACELRVHQRRQPGRVHERDLGEVEHDRRGRGWRRRASMLDELRRGGDVQLAVEHEQAIAAQVGDLRDLPARRAAVRARAAERYRTRRQWRRSTNQTVVPSSVSTPQRSASRPTRKRPKPPGSSSAPVRGVRREALAVVDDLDAHLGVPAARAARPAASAPPWRTALVTTSETSSRSVSMSSSAKSAAIASQHPRRAPAPPSPARAAASARACARPSRKWRARDKPGGNRARVPAL